MTDENPLVPLHFIEKIDISCLYLVGKNRSSTHDCQIKANNDIEAVSAWLNEYSSVPTTYRTYKKEAQRLLLWCAIHMKKSLSDLTRDDFEDYSEFLRNPEPASFWCGKRSAKKETWKPFVSGLSPGARATAIVVIQSLMTYLVEAGYLSKNPLSLIKKKIKPHLDEYRKIKSMEQALEKEEIDALLSAIETLPEESALLLFEKNRLRFLIYLLIFTGIRVHELVSHSWNAFRNIDGKWWLFILGKGQKPRSIPVHNDLLQHIKRYRTFLGKSLYPTLSDNSSLITPYQQERPISERQINSLIKKIAHLAAEKFIDNPQKQHRLKKMSAHRFRHLFASLQDDASIPLTHIRESLGHSDSKTTQIYLHASDKLRHRFMQKISVVSEKG